MRISDWSSDVCSSDLPELPAFVGVEGRQQGAGRLAVAQQLGDADRQRQQFLGFLVVAAGALLEGDDPLLDALQVGPPQLGGDGLGVADRVDRTLDRGGATLEEAKPEDTGVDAPAAGAERVREA